MEGGGDFMSDSGEGDEWGQFIEFEESPVVNALLMDGLIPPRHLKRAKKSLGNLLLDQQGATAKHQPLDDGMTDQTVKMVSGGKVFNAESNGKTSNNNQPQQNPRMSGRVFKRGFRWRCRWVERLIELKDGVLSYFECDTGLLRGHLKLSSRCVVDISAIDNRPFAFTVKSPDSTIDGVWHLAVGSEAARVQWMAALTLAMAHAALRTPPRSPGSSESSRSPASSPPSSAPVTPPTPTNGRGDWVSGGSEGVHADRPMSVSSRRDLRAAAAEAQRAAAAARATAAFGYGALTLAAPAARDLQRSRIDGGGAGAPSRQRVDTAPVGFDGGAMVSSVTRPRAGTAAGRQGGESAQVEDGSSFWNKSPQPDAGVDVWGGWGGANTKAEFTRQQQQTQGGQKPTIFFGDERQRSKSSSTGVPISPLQLLLAPSPLESVVSQTRRNQNFDPETAAAVAAVAAASGVNWQGVSTVPPRRVRRPSELDVLPCQQKQYRPFAVDADGLAFPPGTSVGDATPPVARGAPGGVASHSGGSLMPANGSGPGSGSIGRRLGGSIVRRRLGSRGLLEVEEGSDVCVVAVLEGADEEEDSVGAERQLRREHREDKGSQYFDYRPSPTYTLGLDRRTRTSTAGW